MGEHKPLSKTFNGKVFVLINGGSFSNTAIFSSVLRKHKRAIFVGEETGGSEYIICGHTKNVELPNTGITIEMPTLQYLIKDYNERELTGILPDFEIKPTIKNLLNGRDPVLEFTLQMIEEKAQTHK